MILGLLNINYDCEESKLQELYDNKFNELKKQYPEYTEELYIDDIRGTLMRCPLHAHRPSIQILITRWLNLLTEKEVKSSQELSLNEMGLIAAYEGELISRDNPIYQDWLSYRTPARRTAFISLEKTKRLIERIEKIIPYLSEAAQKAANDELTILNKNSQ